MSSSPGPEITVLGLAGSTERRLREYGIVTCAQLWERLDLAKRTGSGLECAGLCAEEASLLSAQVTCELPDAIRADLRSSPFELPPIEGVSDAISDSPRIGEERRRSIADRRRIADVLDQLEDESLPTSMLLTEWMTPVKNQGALGACTGFASSVAREFTVKDELAPLFAYALAKQLDGRPDVVGSYQRYCFQGFAMCGHVRERLFPYSDRPDYPDVTLYLELAKEFRATGFVDVMLESEFAGKQSKLFKAILSGKLNPTVGPQPVSISIPIYESFASATTTKYGLVTRPQPGEALLGGHAMCIAGYIGANDEDGLYGEDWFLTKNSWGTEFAAENAAGYPGYSLIPARYFDESLLWEALVCVAERSPACGARWFELLERNWSVKHAEVSELASAKAGSVCTVSRVSKRHASQGTGSVSRPRAAAESLSR